MAMAVAWSGFNDLGHSVTPILLLMDHFLYRFSTFNGIMKKIYRLEVFGKMHHRIPLFKLIVHLCGGFKCLFKKDENTRIQLRNGLTSKKDRLPPLTRLQYY